MSALNVTVWNEGRHEKKNPAVNKIYPDGIHGVLAKFLSEAGHTVTTATLDEPNHGLSDAVLANTDVMLWWAHLAHGDVEDAIVEKVYQRVLDGMGLIVLHSGHFSKIFKKLMGTSGNLKWRDIGEKERVWVVNPGHPIASGLADQFLIPEEEMYGEPFGIPEPDSLVLVSWFEGGDIFRSGCCYYRGQGKVFYFRPGHETFPTYYNADVQKVILNAVQWAAPTHGPEIPVIHVPIALEKLSKQTGA
jgi:trehalose utilization protein